ncbi:MAG: ribosome biogenesis GTP-binding protein YihA/YsxC [Desulfobacterales bacterium]|nr:ribosome biogenesis GTP-binding protein YihA/YsxC [Desulfobacterales bacterium]
MIVKSAEFVTSATKPSQYPPAELPEIAFAGRSNVGKSSLINTLVNRKRLVKTSNTPGRTQLVNFFDINKTFSFVDLPGYGYAKVPEKVRKEWGPMIETYLSKRETLTGVILILDIRRTPKEEELSFINWLKIYKIPCILVVTKADKLSKMKQKKQITKIAETLLIDKNELLIFSSKSRLGLNQVWNKIETTLDINQNDAEKE